MNVLSRTDQSSHCSHSLNGKLCGVIWMEIHFVMGIDLADFGKVLFEMPYYCFYLSMPFSIQVLRFDGEKKQRQPIVKLPLQWTLHTSKVKNLNYEIVLSQLWGIEWNQSNVRSTLDFRISWLMISPNRSNCNMEK